MNRGACEEAILEKAGQKRPVLQVAERLSLGVQNSFYALDDIFAMRQKKSQQVDMCLKMYSVRHSAL